MYIILFPFQYFEPGSIQIADFILIFGLIINYKKILILLYKNFFIEWKLFVIYCFFLSFIFFYIHNDFAFLKSPLNYLYCYLTVLLVFIYIKTFNLINITFIAILLSSLLQSFLFFTKDHSEDFRIALFFNNPNQLAFYGIILNIFLFLFFPLINFRYKNIISIILFISNTFLILLSISQAGIIINILLIIIVSYKLILKSLISFMMFITCLLIIGTYFYNTQNEFIPLLNASSRVEKEVDEGTGGDNGLEGRNYDRIIKFPQYLIFGAGEAKFTRFNKNFNLELHSALANILFSYGIIGFFLFMSIVIKAILYLNVDNFLFFICFMLFTIPHNMLRWPLFWITILIFYKFNDLKYENNKNNFIRVF